MTGLDWPALCRLGMVHLRLKPGEFWALTPAELALLVGPVGAPPLGKAGLTKLMERFPDETA